jgi:hypothetical protein
VLKKHCIKSNVNITENGILYLKKLLNGNSKYINMKRRSVSKNSENIVLEFKKIREKLPEWKDDLGEVLFKKHKVKSLRDARYIIGRLDRFALADMRSVPDAVEMDILRNLVSQKTDV